MTLLTNPVNVCLIPPILYVIYLIIFPTPSRPTTTPHLYSEEHYNWVPNKHPDVACYKNYTAHELKPYNGLNEKDKDGGRILLAIMRTGHKGEKLERTVFDVTAGRTFYGPGESIMPITHETPELMGIDGMYGNFAGRDASRGMAKQSFDEGKPFAEGAG
jgi:membrane-associated progesterone receptor component